MPHDGACRFVSGVVWRRGCAGGELSPDVVIGARRDGEDANRQAHHELRRALQGDLQARRVCARRVDARHRSEPTSEERAAQLRQELEALWQQMALVLAGTRLAGEHVRRMSGQLGVLVATANALVGEGTAASSDLERVEERAGLRLRGDAADVARSSGS